MVWILSRALVARCENSHASREAAEEFSQDTCWGGVPSVLLRRTLAQPLYWCSDKMTESSRRSLSGMTFARLTPEHGEAIAMWSREAFHAKTSPLRVRVEDWRVSAQAYGGSLPGSFAKLGPPGSGWRTRTLSLTGDLMPCSKNLPTSGTMLRGELCQRRNLAPITSVQGSGFWPTPTVTGNNNRPSAGSSSGFGLATAVKLLTKVPTPTVPNGGRSIAHVTDWRGPLTAYYKGKKVQVDLKAAVHRLMVYTPTVNDAKNSTIPPSQAGRRSMVGQLSRDGYRGPLNPEWVEWLMGWPAGWTGYAPLETGRFLAWRQQHGLIFTNT